MVNRQSLDVMFNLGDIISANDQLDWNIILNTKNVMTDVTLRLINLIDINSGEVTDAALSSICEVSFRNNKILRKRLFKYLVKANKVYGVEFDFNTIVKRLLW